MKRLLGVLGGMGPLATVDFMNKVIGLTQAGRDQDHVPMVVYSVPQVPDRTAAILENAESPLPAMLQGMAVLRQAGAECVAIPCNTAHYWYAELAREGRLPILHIADAACEGLAGRGVGGGNVGLLATSGTLAAGFYQDRLAACGYRCVTPAADDQQKLVMGGIHHVKAGELDAARQVLERAAHRLIQAGAQAIVLACTEIPLVLTPESPPGAAALVDATEALAAACVRWARAPAAAAPKVAAH